MTYALMQNKMLKKRVSSDVKAEASQTSQSSLSAKDAAEKENSHYLMSHLRSALSLGFIIFIVNPSQPSSASHLDRAPGANALLYINQNHRAGK